MAQPFPLTFPDLQIYSRLLRELPQLFIRYLVRPENSQYFPEAFIYKYLQLGCSLYISSLKKIYEAVYPLFQAL